MDYLSVGFFDRLQICNVMHGSAVVARQNKPASREEQRYELQRSSYCPPSKTRWLVYTTG